MSNSTKRMPSEQRQVDAIETVVNLASEQNPDEITTTAIAKHMGLSQGALFRHFPNKDAILKGVIDWVTEKLMSRVDKALAKTDSPIEALEAVFATHIDFVASHPGAPRMLFGELQRAKLTPAKQMAKTLIASYGKRIEGIIDLGKAQGELVADLDSKATATMFIGMIQGLVMQSLLLGDVACIRQNAPVVFAIYLRGIRRSS